MSADTTMPAVACQRRQDGNAAVPSGKSLDIESGGTLKFAGTATNIRCGQLTTVTATDTVVTGLTTVTSVVVSFDDNPGDNPMLVSATIGDQAGSPAAGSIIIKTWQNTSGSDPTPTAATTFSKKVNWIAIGT